jgi:hypothetical protein
LGIAEGELRNFRKAGAGIFALLDRRGNTEFQFLNFPVRNFPVPLPKNPQSAFRNRISLPQFPFPNSAIRNPRFPCLDLGRGLEFGPEMSGEAECQSDNGQGRIGKTASGKNRTPGEKKILHVMPRQSASTTPLAVLRISEGELGNSNSAFRLDLDPTNNAKVPEPPKIPQSAFRFPQFPNHPFPKFRNPHSAIRISPVSIWGVDWSSDLR